jgi:hypothetical protein
VKKVLQAIIGDVLYVVKHPKALMIAVFIFTAGNAFDLPTPAAIIAGLIAGWAALLMWLGD